VLNDPQDDLVDLIRQACAQAVKEKRGAIFFEEDEYHRDAVKLCVWVDGHDLWNVGLNKNHDRDSCEKCSPPSL
jgi:hypothetical protein